MLLARKANAPHQDDAVPQHDNVYSSHPFYMEIRNSQAHGVVGSCGHVKS